MNPPESARDGATGGQFAESAAREPALMRKMADAFAAALDGLPMGHAAVHRFAGRPVRLRVAGGRLAERTLRAFAHLKALDAGGAPPLRIDLWDETATGVPCPVDPALSDLDRQWVASGGLLASTADGRYVSFRYQDSITVLDRRGQRMIGCRRNGSHLSGGEYSKPFVVLLSIWYYDRGVQLLHAGLIARNGSGVLLPGESGTGKSTICLASIAQGLDYLGDDFVGLERTVEGEFIGHSVFSTACLARKNLGRFPDLQPHAVDDGIPEEDKPILFLAELFAERLPAAVPIQAVVLLRIRSHRTECRPARRPDALRAFAASTLHTVVPRPGREALQKIGALVERVPAYWLLLGPDLSDIAPSIDHILSITSSRKPL